MNAVRIVSTAIVACGCVALAWVLYGSVVPDDLALFFYLPYGHSERLADQERGVALVARLGEPNHGRAKHHLGIVRRFGRFPHRNAILGRVTTTEEQRYLDEGGYKG